MNSKFLKIIVITISSVFILTGLSCKKGDDLPTSLTAITGALVGNVYTIELTQSSYECDYRDPNCYNWYGDCSIAYWNEVRVNPIIKAEIEVVSQDGDGSITLNYREIPLYSNGTYTYYYDAVFDGIVTLTGTLDSLLNFSVEGVLPKEHQGYLLGNDTCGGTTGWEPYYMAFDGSISSDELNISGTLTFDDWDPDWSMGPEGYGMFYELYNPGYCSCTTDPDDPAENKECCEVNPQHPYERWHSLGSPESPLTCPKEDCPIYDQSGDLIGYIDCCDETYIENLANGRSPRVCSEREKTIYDHCQIIETFSGTLNQ